MKTIMRMGMLWGLGCLVIAGGTRAQDSTELQAILERLQAIEAQLKSNQDALQANRELLDAITLRLDELEGKRERLGVPDGFEEQGPDFDALRSIQLPEDPTRDALEKYVRDILRATEGQNSFTTEDPQIALLTKVGEEHIDLLIDATIYSQGNDFHATQAIIRLATEKSKDRIVDALPVNHELIVAVVKNGWEEDVKDTLVSELRSDGPYAGSNYVPEKWVQAVAGFEDPETYEALLHYFVHGSNRLFTYDTIRGLPDITIAEHVPEAWKRARASNEWERLQMAIVAAAYGEKEALTVLFDHWGDAEFEYYAGRIRQTILRHTTATGTNEQLKEWYEANKDALVFDGASKKFKAP